MFTTKPKTQLKQNNYSNKISNAPCVPQYKQFLPVPSSQEDHHCQKLQAVPQLPVLAAASACTDKLAEQHQLGKAHHPGVRGGPELLKGGILGSRIPDIFVEKSGYFSLKHINGLIFYQILKKNVLNPLK